MKRSKLFFLVISLFILYGCSPKSPTAVILSTKDDNTDLGNFNSYAWLPPGAEFAEIAIMAVEDQLNRRGFTLDINNPDLLVAVHIITEPSDELVRTPLYNNLDYRGPGFYSGPFTNYYFNDQITVPIVSGYGTEELNYASGTVVVDVIDREKMEIIWRGWSEDQRNHPLDVINDLPGYISQIFEKFPIEPVQ